MIVKFHLCPCRGLTSRPFEPTLLAMSGHMYISMQCVLFRSSQIAVSLYSSSMSNDRVDSDQRTRYRSLSKARSRIICRVYMTEWLARWLLTARKMNSKGREITTPSATDVELKKSEFYSALCISIFFPLSSYNMSIWDSSQCCNVCAYQMLSMQCVLFRSSQIAVSLYSTCILNNLVVSDQRARFCLVSRKQDFLLYTVAAHC